MHYGTQDATLVGKNANDGFPTNIIPAVFPNDTYRNFGGGTLNVTGTFPWTTLTSITGYTNGYVHALTSSANVGLTQYLEVSRASEWYEEMRLASKEHGPLSWIAGVTALRQHSSDIADFVLTAEETGGPTGSGYVFQNSLLTTSYADPSSSAGRLRTECGSQPAIGTRATRKTGRTASRLVNTPT